MRIILVLVYFTLITPGKCLTLPDFLFWMKYLPFYGSSYRTPRPWRFEDFQSEDIVPHIRIMFQLFGGFLSDPVGDPYTPAGHKRIRERCNGNIEIGFITPRQKPTVLQTAYKWMISKFFGKNQTHVVPRKDPSECDTKLHLRLLYGAACALMISPLIIMLTVATVLVLGESEEESSSHQPEPAEFDLQLRPGSTLSTTMCKTKEKMKKFFCWKVSPRENLLEEERACISTPVRQLQRNPCLSWRDKLAREFQHHLGPRRATTLLKEECPGPSVAPPHQNVNETLTPRRKVSFNNIVRVRSIPPVNRGLKASCSEEHKERTFVYDKKPRRNIFKGVRSFWSCLKPERN
ncbi:uncharacterized protein LOC142652025 isoform X3 [Rhinoderma darwinii]|uniref:uncharacterized protein LOC142652025 isoform X3 n=1 Tax=Rhinoderma darwinii TaxID=43563 RepID=UPI003F67F9AF